MFYSAEAQRVTTIKLEELYVVTGGWREKDIATVLNK